MKELREEAKRLGINSFQKTMEVLSAEIEQARTAPEIGVSPPVEYVRRDIDGSNERNIIDPTKRAAEIKSQRVRDGFDPLAPSYKIHSRGQMPGWHYRWARDAAGRINGLKEEGYTVDESCEPISQGDNSNGGKLIRMMIPASIAKEDYNKVQQRIKDEEAALRQANVKGGIKQEDGAYGEITIGQSKVTLGAK